VLELLAAGAPQQEVLDSLLRGIEAVNPGMICSVMLLDEEGTHLFVAAGPSLPGFFNEAIHGLPVGYGNGSCGKAVTSNSRVIVEDIRSDPLWAPYRELALRAGLGSCWSEPVHGANGKVLGSFAIYQREPQAPSVAHMALLDQAASLTGIAVEQARAAQALRVGEARFRSLYDHAPVALWQQDWSAARAAVEELADSGVEDVAQWLEVNPSHLPRLAGLVRITDVNAAAPVPCPGRGRSGQQGTGAAGHRAEFRAAGHAGVWPGPVGAPARRACVPGRELLPAPGRSRAPERTDAAGDARP
jgi:signal transduction protein with GAF and PtsI domain